MGYQTWALDALKRLDPLKDKMSIQEFWDLTARYRQYTYPEDAAEEWYLQQLQKNNGRMPHSSEDAFLQNAGAEGDISVFFSFISVISDFANQIHTFFLRQIVPKYRYLWRFIAGVYSGG